MLDSSTLGLVGRTTSEAMSTSGIPAREQQQSQPFLFLDLPKELRLMVYDYFVDRSHRKVEAQINKRTVSVTLVVPNPIPPVHLTCKIIYAEASVFLKAKVISMSVPRATPRLIVHAGPTRPLVKIFGLIDTLFCQISRVMDMGQTIDLQHVKGPHHGSLDEEFDSISEELTAFSISAGLQLIKMDPQEHRLCWWEEAESALRDMSTDVDTALDDPALADQEVLDLADTLASAPGAKSKALQIVVRGSHEDFSMQSFAKGLSNICKHLKIKAFLYTSQPDDEEYAYPDYLRHGGAMDEKTWAEEWM